MPKSPLARLLLIASLATLAACTSRTLPLPPPTVDPVPSPNAQGLVMISGTAQEGASVGVLNDSTMKGVIVTTASDGCDPACPFEAEIEAAPGDSLRVWQFFETTQGRDVQVPER